MSFLIPELRVGKPLRRRGRIIYPLFEAQQRLFEDDALADIGCLSRRMSVLATGIGKNRPAGPSVSNNSTNPLLALSGRRITKGQLLRMPILVPPGRTLAVPVVGHREDTGGMRSTGQAVKGTVGAFVVAAFIRYLHIFGSEGLCRRAWPSVRVLGFGESKPLASDEIDDLLSTLHRLKWERVKSLGMGQEWVALRSGLRGSAVSLGRQLVHLELSRNDIFQ